MAENVVDINSRNTRHTFDYGLAILGVVCTMPVSMHSQMGCAVLRFNGRGYHDDLYFKGDNLERKPT